jgi:hypothetical protein
MSVARVRMARLGADVSALGFGCASLGSRVSPGNGLAALGRAWDAGVTWYDVAPSYGDGEAEGLLGRFFAGKPREAFQIVTKVGIPPSPPSLKQRIARPVLRAALEVAPGLRAAIRRRRPPPVKPPIEAAMIPVSLDSSLRRLGVDHIDVLALHEAKPDEVVRDDVLEALTRVIAAGKVKVAAIASSPEAAAAGMAAAPQLYGMIQTAGNPFLPGADPGLPADRVTHSAFGNEGGPARLAAMIGDDADLRAAFAAAGYEPDAARAARDFLADHAFAANAGGVVIMSMFHPGHLAANLARHARPRDDAAILRLGAMVAGRAG